MAFSAEVEAAAADVARSAAALADLTAAGETPSESGLAPKDADSLRDLADGCLDGLAGVARLEARLAALKVRFAAEYARTVAAMAPPDDSPRECTMREMAVVAEVACVLSVSERSAGSLLAEAHVLTTSLPLTLAALHSGLISWQHARIMTDEAAVLGRAGASALEAHFLDMGAPDHARGCPAGELVPGRFRAKVRTWRERHHPASIETRHTKSAADRRLEYCPDRDGMAWLSAYLPADTAAGIWERTTAAARALQRPGETRTLSQLRADIAATCLPDTRAGCDVAGVPSPRAQVLVTVPALSLVGVTDEPALLDGYGPIPASMARRLVSDGAESFYRVLTDPRDGAPLEIGRTSYRVPRAMRHWLRLRDGKCPFPGCNNQSLDNDADHVLAWADGGTTGISNLGQPCPKHHRLKHGTAWRPTGATRTGPPGWISPTGRHYRSEHQDWEPPVLPPGLLAVDGLLAGGAARDQCMPEDVAGEPPEEAGPDWDAFMDVPRHVGEPEHPEPFMTMESWLEAWLFQPT